MEGEFQQQQQQQEQQLQLVCAKSRWKTPRLNAGARRKLEALRNPNGVVPIRRNATNVVLFVSKLGTLLLVKVFVARSWPVLQLVTFFQAFAALLHPKLSRNAAVNSWAVPTVGLTILQPAVRTVFPDFYRTARFWRRLLPIYARYIITKLQTRGKPLEDKDKIWGRRHEWGGKMIRQLVLDMSGFYVKSAQILASKADLVPQAWRKELSRNLDDVPPRPFKLVKRSIQQELEHCHRGPISLDAMFLHIEAEATAAASIAQVHAAVLRDGRSVVLKVQHLGMEQIMHSDLRNLASVARFLKGQLPVDLAPIVKEIQITIPLEFDFEREVWFMKTIKRSIEANGFTDIVCPLPYEEFCTHRLIVMQKLDGVPFTRILDPNAAEDTKARLPEVKRLVKRLVEAYGQMLLVDGVFHADPHAGNLTLLPDGRLGLLDYGQSKVLGETLRLQVGRMVLSIAEADDSAAASLLTEMGIHFESAEGDDAPVQALAMMARILFDTCYIEEATVSPMAANSILRRFPMTCFNQELWLVVRMILILRGLLYSLGMDLSAATVWKKSALRMSVNCEL